MQINKINTPRFTPSPKRCIARLLSVVSSIAALSTVCSVSALNAFAQAPSTAAQKAITPAPAVNAKVIPPSVVGVPSTPSTSAVQAPAPVPVLAKSAPKIPAGLEGPPLTANVPVATVTQGRPTPERYLADQEEFAKETQRLSNQLSVLSIEEQVEQRMKSLRQSRGEGAIYNNLPTLIGIGGIDGQLIARVAYPGNNVIRVRTGDRLPSNHVVQVVTPQFVILRKGNEEYRLPIVFTRSDQVTASTFSQPQRPFVPFDSAGPIVGRQSPPANR